MTRLKLRIHKVIWEFEKVWLLRVFQREVGLPPPPFLWMDIEVGAHASVKVL